MTTRLHRALARLSSDLAEHRGGFALVGGVAVSVRAEPRLTRDLDVAVAVADDTEAEGLVRTLVAGGYEVSSVLDQDKTGRFAAARLLLPHEGRGGVVADLLFASSGIEPEIVAAAESLAVFPGLVLPVATVAHLVALKLLARDDRDRPQDADDLRALRQVATSEDLRRAREAARLIVERGFGRGRDLVGAFDEWSASA